MTHVTGRSSEGARRSSKQHLVWGVELSPFLLKVESMLTFAGIPFRRLPRDGTRSENWRVSRLIDKAKNTRTVVRYPQTSVLDEYPLVPFVVTPDEEVLDDSSAIAAWLDEVVRPPTAPLIPADPAQHFVARLIDEAFDELGLYMVHHYRWKVAAGNNGRPGLRLAREYGRLLPRIFHPMFASWFERRQVRRLPYLFSVAPAGYRQACVPRSHTPPELAGFPPTHDLLETTWGRAVDACEGLLRQQPFLLGQRFTLADASVYGQLSMNLTDTAANRLLRERAPTTHRWLCSIRDRSHVWDRDRSHSVTDGNLALSPRLSPLLAVVLDVFVPLMRQNDDAYTQLQQSGESVFNERAWNQRRSLYNGEILGHPFRSVAKTFQVRVWREIREHWRTLPAHARASVAAAVDGYGSRDDLQQHFG